MSVAHRAAHRPSVHSNCSPIQVVKSMDAPIEIFVYNTGTDEVRVAIVMPTEDWNGEGCLGACVWRRNRGRAWREAKRASRVSLER